MAASMLLCESVSTSREWLLDSANPRLPGVNFIGRAERFSEDWNSDGVVWLRSSIRRGVSLGYSCLKDTLLPLLRLQHPAPRRD